MVTKEDTGVKTSGTDPGNDGGGWEDDDKWEDDEWEVGGVVCDDPVMN